ncbi:DUF1656 domain-containing protein [Xylophilus sp.]|uniref:DUF1656 domain-containing protein n=1 Tax=Xylophilus sp. TaxID=2653893 RepID=UPI0013BA02D7|nr:DUF1656 domain-containing protein [Xylophilus sp.]KAF1048992.1 MAG: Protein AaeX [Xylophilus sp.]
MIGEASFYGLYLPWLMLLALAAWPLLWAVRRLLVASGAYRWVWHPALFDISLYVLLLYALVRLTLLF